MRQLSEKWVGGIERIDADAPDARVGLSLRAVLIGVVGVVLISVANPYNTNVVENTMLIGNHLPVSVLFIMLVLVLVVNPVLGRLPDARSAFDPARLVVRWACVLPISALLWRGPVDPGAPGPMGTDRGLAGLVVGVVWTMSGALAGAAALAAEWYSRTEGRRDGGTEGQRNEGERGRGGEGETRASDSPSPQSAIRNPQSAIAAVALAVVFAGPASLTPVLTGWLDQTPPGARSLTVHTLAYVGGTLALLALSVPIERWLRGRRPLSAAELVVSMTMMLVACVAPGSGFHRLWAHELVAPFYHLQSHPRWQPLVEALPRWLVPSADPQNHDVIYNFYAGQANVPWGAWGVTALVWAPFVLAFFIGSLFVVAVFRRQWEEAEKLSFPLAVIALEVLRPPRAGRLLNEMLRSRLFWWSVGIVVLLQTLYGLHVYFPDVPYVEFEYHLYSALDAPPWRHLPDWIKAKNAFLAVVGVTFFLSTEMSFSLWAFVILLGVVEMLGKTYQVPVQERFDDHQIGAYLAYGGVIVWIARRHLAAVFRSIFRSQGPPSPPRPLSPSASLADKADGERGRGGEGGMSSGLISERAAAIGFAVCFVIAAGWLTAAGLPVHVAVLITLVVFLLSLVIGRVVAESGLLFVQYNCWPHLFAEATFPQLLTPKTHTLIHFTTIATTMDQREGLMPYAFNAARMADGVAGLRQRRRLFAVWIGCIVLALVVAGAVHLDILYEHGATLGDDWAGRLLPEQTYNRSADFADLRDGPPARVQQVRREHATHVATGAGIVLMLCLLRYRFIAWPLHPIGFLMANTVPMRVFWLSILIGWLCKWLVMRLGGVPVYRKLSPLFLGLIVGTTFSSVFWMLVKAATYTGGEKGEPVMFLPG